MGLLKKEIFTGLTILSSVNPLTVTPLRCISINNQECKVRSEIINVNKDESVFYPFSIKTSKCSGSCNNIDDPFPNMCVPDVIKNINIKLFNLMSRTNETWHTKWHEPHKCQCWLDSSVCNNKQRWNKNKCKCECKKLIDKGVCDKGFIWNLSNYECECDKSCDVGEYLDYENCKCRKRLVDELVEKWAENTDEAKITETTLFEQRMSTYVLIQFVLSWL